MTTESTKVRDTIISNITDKYMTRDEIAEKFKLHKDSTGTAIASLAKRAVLVRRRQEGTNAYEYAVGPRIEFGKKHLGHRFPIKGTRTRKALAPTSNQDTTIATSDTQLGLIIRLNGKAETLTLADARALYHQLSTLFNHKG